MTKDGNSHPYSQARGIILYDGICNLCDFAVRFILPRDRFGLFQFASLQGAYARGLKLPDLDLARSANPLDAPDSVLLIQDDRVYHSSNAILRIAAGLRFPWNLFALLRIIPTPLRDAIYRWVARNRYRWFGRQETCLLPQPEWKSRFLD